MANFPFDFDPFPVLNTQRLVLRAISLSDVNTFFSLRTHPKVLRYLDRKADEDVVATSKIIHSITDDIKANRAIAWAVCLVGNDELIGTVSFWQTKPQHFRAEIGYLLNPDYWGQGIIKEAIEAVLIYGFSKMNLHSVEAVINPENKASKNVLLHFGFVQEAYFKQNYFYDGRFLDSAVYSLLKTNFADTDLQLKDKINSF